MRTQAAVLAVGVMAVLGACSPTPEQQAAADEGSTGHLHVALTGGNTLATIAVRNVFAINEAYVIECRQKDHLLEGEAFCDELIVVPPGVYELVVQTHDASCHSELDHYKVVVEPGGTTELEVTLICGTESGGLDVVVSSTVKPTVTGITFKFDTTGQAANKYVCQGPGDVRVELQVDDADSGCALVDSWSVVDQNGVDVTALYLSGFQSLPGTPCRYSAVFDASAPIGTYQVTFGVTDPDGHQTTFKFPIHVIACTACGNGVMDPGEQCDDGNFADNDACRNNCTLPYCGDGAVGPGEQCDDGNTWDLDGCRNNCTLPRCGDGTKDMNEQCDDGNLNEYDGCRSDCTIPRCGDGVVDPGEACDDGNTVDTDACRNNCTLQTCGNGIVEPGEQCDDGNFVNTDGCHNNCTLPVCGDGFVDPGEQCDDGNFSDFDGCRTDCTIPVCGDGIRDPGEQCDDGNVVDDDGCRNGCILPVCGDGIRNNGEQCDDGNLVDTDACRNDCTLPFCGDGVRETGEQCDDGNQVNTDGCRNDCTVPRCGDGIVDTGELCDDGNLVDTDGCRNNCTLPSCGDGTVDPGEQCDDGNAINTDACRNDCLLPYCGDGIVDPGEQCDDGNFDDFDGCSNACTLPTCGLAVDKTCQVHTTPTTNYVCTKPIDSLSMIWNGTSPIRINAWKGTVGGSTLLASMRLVQPGELVTITGYAGSPNDVYWEIFDAATNTKLGTSTFHVSCSDTDMNGAEDCGKLEGNGKGLTGYINNWVFAGMSGGGVVLDCGFVNGFPANQNCDVTIEPAPGCDTLGRPSSLTFTYTAGACDPTGNLQGDKAACSASGTLPANVTLTFLKDPTKYTVTPGTSLTLGQSFTIATVGGGDFPAEILVQLSGGGVSQTLKIHTDCAVPLRVGDRFGALTLSAFDGDDGKTEIVYGYRLTNTGGALTGLNVTDSVLGHVAGPITLADGETRDFTASGRLNATTTNAVTAQGLLANGATCQASDSTTVSFVPPQATCADGHPTALTFLYEGGDCATTNPQSGKFVCSGVAPTTGTVQVVITRDTSKVSVTPTTQTITVGSTFEVYRSDSPGTALLADTGIAIVQNGVVVQNLTIHTSCSQPLNVGDEFGSLKLVGFTPTY